MIHEGVMLVSKNARHNYITDACDDEDARNTIEAADTDLRRIAE